MSQPPGPEKLASLGEDIRPTVAAELRKEIEVEFTRMREDINQGKIYRAEQHAGYMRNWLAILTVTISVVLVGFGFLGYTRTSDIEAYRKQIAADATDVKALSAGVRENSKTVADSVNSIRTNQQQVADLNTKINDTEARITNTDKNIAAIEKRSEQAERRIVAAVNNTSALAQRTRNDFQSSVASGFLGDMPSISSAKLVQGPALSSIEGTRFGKSAGHVFVDIQRIDLATLQLPKRIEIQPPYKKWTDTRIDFELSPSEYQRIKDARASQSSASSVSRSLGNVSVNLSEGLISSTYLSLLVETSEGRFSISASPLSVSWP
jgi:cell division protein FtsL